MVCLRCGSHAAMKRYGLCVSCLGTAKDATIRRAKATMKKQKGQSEYKLVKEIDFLRLWTKEKQ